MTYKRHRIRLYLNGEQMVLIEKHFGCNRWVYNWGIRTKVEEYAKNKITLSKIDLTKRLTIVKQQEPWLSEVDTLSLYSSLDHLDSAFTRFFRAKTGFPNFKKKHSNHQSYTVHRSIHVESGKIKLPKLGWVKTHKDTRIIDGPIKQATIIRVPSGKYYVSVLFESAFECVEPLAITPETTIGVDLGLTSFITTSNGLKVEPCRALIQYEAKLKKQQRWLARKQRGSKNYQKQRIKVARTHEKASNTRSHFLHNITKKLTSDNQTVGTIVLEDLAVRSMMKSKHLSKAIGDAAWTMFTNQLQYKSGWYGVNLLRIGRYEPSTKMCSVCGHINRELTLRERTWTCPVCQTNHDRDINAAINIKAIGLADQNRVGWSSPELTLGETRALAQSKNQEHQALVA